MVSHIVVGGRAISLHQGFLNGHHHLMDRPIQQTALAGRSTIGNGHPQSWLLIETAGSSLAHLNLDLGFLAS
jgi:hypothetical protein